MAKKKHTIIDYISGMEVNATPEEVDAVQVFSRNLVEDYNYKKEQIMTHPQYRVKSKPSDDSGQSLSDTGKLKKATLKPAHNLKMIFKSIRNYLATNTTGATRNEVLAGQIINIIFCKLYDEKYTAPNEIVRFRAEPNDTAKEISNRVHNLFNEVKSSQAEIFEKEDKLVLDDESLAYVVGELQYFSLTNSERDVVADAF